MVVAAGNYENGKIHGIGKYTYKGGMSIVLCALLAFPSLYLMSMFCLLCYSFFDACLSVSLNFLRSITHFLSV